MRYIGLIFHAPLQSWGGVSLIDSNSGSPRNTELFPTKSAILGFLRSALGVERSNTDEDDLRAAHILIRTDRQGQLSRDYQVAQRTHHGYRAGTTKVIPKFFLQEATFVVLVGHENPDVIERLSHALQAPHWAPFLGRRAHVPSLPPFLGEVETDDPRHFLGVELPIFWGADYSKSKRVITYDSRVDGPENNPATDEVSDEPLSLHPRDRLYSSRKVQTYSVTYDLNEAKGSSIQQYADMKKVFITKGLSQ